jgi:hypothetical protein
VVRGPRHLGVAPFNQSAAAATVSRETLTLCCRAQALRGSRSTEVHPLNIGMGEEHELPNVR